MEEEKRARDDEALRDSQRESMVAGTLGLGGGKVGFKAPQDLAGWQCLAYADHHQRL